MFLWMTFESIVLCAALSEQELQFQVLRDEIVKYWETENVVVVDESRIVPYQFDSSNFSVWDSLSTVDQQALRNIKFKEDHRLMLNVWYKKNK